MHPILPALGLVALTAASPLPQVNESPNTFCPTIDLNDEEAVLDLWNGDLNIGQAFRIIVQNFGADDWLSKVVADVLPGSGNAGISGCGDPTASCSPVGTCDEMADKGYGNVYWILQAVKGFHDKLFYIHEALQSNTILDSLRLDEISKDFSAPKTISADALSAIISSALFLAGGIGGVAGVASQFVGAAASGGIGNVKAYRARARSGQVPDINLDQIQEAAERQAEQAAKFGRAAGTVSASTYLVGSTFGQVSSIVNPSEEGQVEPIDLAPVLSDIFTTVTGDLEQLGRLATGRANEGEDYEWLPGQKGGTEFGGDETISDFFSDGRMLIGLGNPAFNETIDATFALLQTKIVDAALQAGGYRVVGSENQDECPGEDVDGMCMWLMYKEPERDYYANADDTVYKNLKEKYSFDLAKYYGLAKACSVSSNEVRLPNMFAIPPTGAVDCWYGIEAYKYRTEENCSVNPAGGGQSCGADEQFFEDF